MSLWWNIKKAHFVFVIVSTVISCIVYWSVHVSTNTEKRSKESMGIWGLLVPGQDGPTKLDPVIYKIPAVSEVSLIQQGWPNEVPPAVEALRKHRPSSDKAVLLLHWSTFYGKRDWLGVGSQRYHDDFSQSDYVCNYTADKSDLAIADYVVIHARMFDEFPLPTRLRLDQKWILFVMESPHFLSLGGRRDLEKLQGVFNITTNHRWDADIFKPYGYCRRPHGGEKITAPPPDYNYAKGKSKLVAWFVSNCQTPSQREVYGEKLKQHVNIDIFGKCGTVQCSKDQDVSDCRGLLNSTYKFYLAFENSLCEDYASEKLFTNMNLSVNIIPIVLGGANYSKLLPPDSYLDVKNFTSPQKLADYLKYLDRNDDVYSRYFRWRREFLCGDYFPEICVQMHLLRNKVSPTTHIGKDWSIEGACQSTSDYYKNVT